MSTSVRRTALAAAAAAGLALSVPAGAAAQNVIPGDTPPGDPILTNLPGVDVTLDDVDRAAGTVAGTFVNDTGLTLTCTNPHPNPDLARGGTVSTAAVVEGSMDYYSRFRPSIPGAVDIDEVTSILFVGNVGLMVYGPLWPLMQLMPTGSAAPFLAPEVAAAAAITDNQTFATQRGLTGAIPEFTVNDGATHDWTSNLGPAGIGERDEVQLGALFVCREGDEESQHYAFAGYEEFEGAAPGAPGTGSLDVGSLLDGSSGGEGGSLGSEAGPGPDNGDDNGDDPGNGNGDDNGGDPGNGEEPDPEP